MTARIRRLEEERGVIDRPYSRLPLQRIRMQMLV